MLIPKIHKIEYNFFQIFKTFTFEAMTQDRKQGPFCFHSGEIGLKKLEILPFPNLIEFFNIQFMQRFVQNFLPEAFNSTWITNSIRREGQSHVSLRNDDDLYAPPARLSSTSNHPLSTLPSIWDSLADENLKFIRDKSEFDKTLKIHFLKQLSTHIKCNNPFCPSCVLHVT